ncbi:MAG: hypothetical protein HY650_01405 [Acidobacteria bacterium]|nr:hypothetical protein [Acidobacteriota bacterium]
MRSYGWGSVGQGIKRRESRKFTDVVEQGVGPGGLEQIMPGNCAGLGGFAIDAEAIYSASIPDTHVSGRGVRVGHDGQPDCGFHRF